MSKISNDKSKYIRRGVVSPKIDTEKGTERDMEIDDTWHVELKSPDVRKAENVRD